MGKLETHASQHVIAVRSDCRVLWLSVRVLSYMSLHRRHLAQELSLGLTPALFVGLTLGPLSHVSHKVAPGVCQTCMRADLPRSSEETLSCKVDPPRKWP